ncbi:MAG TPA: DUF465 domain-containing protein [Candidatus Nitrosotenuis sp.]|nr:DUF465 domain-containing protein [Candidatus Nitrosotenuis sp.]
MNLEAHLSHLRERHQALDTKIQHYERLPTSDPVTVHDLKKKKLKLKEEIERFLAINGQMEIASKRP